MPDFQLVPVDHDPWASAPQSGAEQWQSAIAANAQRQAQAPSTGQQIMDIAANTGQMLAAPLMAGPRLMGDVAEGRVDPNSPEAIRRSADVALNTAGMGMMGAERGAVGAMGGALARYDQALREGKITKPEYDAFREALSSEPVTADHLRPSYDALKQEQGGFSTVSIGKLIDKTGLPADQVKTALLEAAKRGDVTIHPTTVPEASLSEVEKSGLIKIPGHDNFFNVVFKRQPLARSVLSRDASGRPLTTAPFSMGNENAVLEKGAALNQSVPLSSITTFHGSPHDLGAEVPQAIVQKRGENNFLVKSPDNPDNRLAMVVEPDAVRVKTVDVRRANRNAGISVSLYEKAIAFAAERGLPLRSDVTVTNDALHVYDALRRRGYDVMETPGTTTSAAGKSNEKHVFEVRGIPQRASGGIRLEPVDHDPFADGS